MFQKDFKTQYYDFLNDKRFIVYERKVYNQIAKNTIEFYNIIRKKLLINEKIEYEFGDFDINVLLHSLASIIFPEQFADYNDEKAVAMNKIKEKNQNLKLYYLCNNDDIEDYSAFFYRYLNMFAKNSGIKVIIKPINLYYNSPNLYAPNLFMLNAYVASEKKFSNSSYVDESIINTHYLESYNKSLVRKQNSM